jgi:hypothetical protein
MTQLQSSTYEMEIPPFIIDKSNVNMFTKYSREFEYRGTENNDFVDLSNMGVSR